MHFKAQHSLWNRISYLGLNYYANYSENNSAIVANRLNFLFWIVLATNLVLLTIIRLLTHRPISIYSYKLIILLGICTINFLLAQLSWHKTVRFLLIFSPAIVFISFPLLLNKCLEVDVIFDPLVILGYSIFPQLIYKSNQKSFFFRLAILFYFLVIIFHYDLLKFRLGESLTLFSDEASFGLYFKMGFGSIYLFIHTTLFFMQKQNQRYEGDLIKTRKLAEKQSKNNSKVKVRLLKQEKELREALATKDKFFSIIAHDIKNPLNALMGLASVVDTSYDSINHSKKRKYIHHINKAGKELQNLLENLLQWSRLRTDIMAYKPEQFYLSDLIFSCIQITKISAQKKEIAILNDTSKKLYAYGDFAMISTVLRNLISNAIKFSNQGSEIILESEQYDDYIKLWVNDRGVGIEPQYLERLFRLDISYSTSGTQGEEGSGLGLLLCKEFIEKNNGDIGVESTFGKGSRFWFTLPLK